jgi:tetratricopeptide (TPR) repeat protein
MTDAWDLLMGGDYLAAAEAYSPGADEGDFGSLHNRGTAFLAAGQAWRAVADFERLIDSRPSDHRNDGDFLKLGAALWQLGEVHQAVHAWQAGVDAPYTDAAGGVECPGVLLYAGERLGDDSLRAESLRLLRHVARRKPRGWPGPVAEFLLGEMSPDVLDHHARDDNPEPLAVRQQAQADFYVAVRALRTNDWTTFEKRLRSCASNPRAILEPEYHLAVWEVQQGIPNPTSFRTRFGG